MRIQNWLLIQRVSLFLYLAAGILLLIYALGFISNVYIFYAYGNAGLVEFYHDMQEVNDSLLWNAIIVVLFALGLFLLELRKHPAGIFTLIITIIIVIVSVSICVYSLVILADAKLYYSELDLGSLDRFIERGTFKYQYSTLTYDLGLGGYILFLLSSLFMAFCVIRNAFKLKAVSQREGQ